MCLAAESLEQTKYYETMSTGLTSAEDYRLRLDGAECSETPGLYLENILPVPVCLSYNNSSDDNMLWY